MNQHLQQFNEVYNGLEDFLNTFEKSKILQDFCIKSFESFIFSNLVNFFFDNLNKKIIKELDLPRGKIGQIKEIFREERRKCRLALSQPMTKKIIVEEDYIDFKKKINLKFPEFIKIIQGIEKEIDYKKINGLLKQKRKQIVDVGKESNDVLQKGYTQIVEEYVKKTKSFPTLNEIKQSGKGFVGKIFPEYSQMLKKTLDSEKKNRLKIERQYKKNFEKRLYKKWEEPLDNLETLIKISLEVGQKVTKKLRQKFNRNDEDKIEAIIKIHARSLQISNEILLLLKAGYPDGANARWRSLHELAVISFFLAENGNEVSKRYLLHDIVKRFKEAKDYQDNYKKLDYLPLSRKEFNDLRCEKEKLCKIYPDGFEKDYGWIPRSILSNRHFRKLEEYVRLSKFRPFYNSSCDSVHGGARGFYRLGLLPERQHEMFLVGASDYGLGNPLQNTAISIGHVSSCLISLVKNFEIICAMFVINNYIKETCQTAAKIEIEFTKEIRSKKRNKQ